MDHYATLTVPAEAVFEHLADPARLGDWLPQIVRVDIEPVSVVGIGSAFTVTVRNRRGEQQIDAEIAAHEPSWLIAYRLLATGMPLLIRVTCTTSVEGTRVHVQQTEGTEPLLIDLAGITEPGERAG